MPSGGLPAHRSWGAGTPFAGLLSQGLLQRAWGSALAPRLRVGVGTREGAAGVFRPTPNALWMLSWPRPPQSPSVCMLTCKERPLTSKLGEAIACPAGV